MARLFDRSATPLYAQIADVMRERIVKGTLPIGTRIPTLKELVAEFEVASITVRQAIQLLKNEGLLSPEQGRGTFVCGKPPTHPKVRVETSLASLAELYRTHAPRLVPLEEGTRTPDIKMEDGFPAAAYHFLYRIHAGARQYNSVISAYIDESVFALAPERFRTELIIPVLLDLPGVQIATARQTLTVAAAGAEVAKALRISLNAPVAELRRVFCAADGTVIYLAELVYRGDFIRLDMDLLG